MSEYNIEVLKKMIRVLDSNIQMFSKYNDERSIQRMHDMVKERRDLAALIENDGILDYNMIRPDTMSYSACAGADTSWWTRGT